MFNRIMECSESSEVIVIALFFCLSLKDQLRTTVHLVSYIRNSVRFWYEPPLVPVVKILKKVEITGENLGESGGQTFKGSD